MPRHVLTDELRQAQCAAAGVVAVGKYQVKLAPAFAAFAQRQRLEFAAREFAAHRVFRKPGKALAETGRMN